MLLVSSPKKDTEKKNEAGAKPLMVGPTCHGWKAERAMLALLKMRR